MPTMQMSDGCELYYMLLVQSALTRQHPRHHGLRADLGKIGGAKLVLGYQQTQHGEVGGLLQTSLFEGGQLSVPLFKGFDGEPDAPRL